MIRSRISLLGLAFAYAGSTASALTKQTLTHELLWSVGFEKNGIDSVSMRDPG
jgi:hypothetical protein